MKLDPRAWFGQLWPRETGRRAVLSDFATVGTLKHFLADLALRGNVFSGHPVTDSLYQLGRMEGRRELALEVIQLAGQEPQALWAYIERSAGPDKKVAA